MTPNPKDSRFIRHDILKGASENVVHLFEEYQTLKWLTQQDNWHGLRADNVTFGYSTYNGTSEISIKFFDKNNHSHIL